jgi:hypothetical protein
MAVPSVTTDPTTARRTRKMADGRLLLNYKKKKKRKRVMNM